MKKKYLVCIDSDGCAVNSMTIKHRLAFGPLAIKEFGLEKYSEELLKFWDRLNLYSSTRGINRYKGLFKLLELADRKYKKIEGIEEYKKWIDETDTFSEDSLASYKSNLNSRIIKKVINWSKDVNRKIEEIPDDEINLFHNVKEAISKISEKADIYIVSSANKNAVLKEWDRLGILEFTSGIFTQERATKKEAISILLKEYGYDKNKTLKIGDALGDLEAALSNDVYFYPIVPTREEKSWMEFTNKYMDEFFNDKYWYYQEDLLNDFKTYLKKGDKL